MFLYTSFRPAGGNFTVEIADNQAVTTLSYKGTKTSNWVDGQPHPELVRNTFSSNILFSSSSDFNRTV